MEEEQKKTKEKHHNNDSKYTSKDLKLWIFRILTVNLILVIVWQFTARNDTTFVSHFTFASTVTSIILSVLAIILSFTGESKTQAIRDKIEQEAEEIIIVTQNFERQVKELSNKLEVVVHNTDSLMKFVLNDNPEPAQVVNGISINSAESSNT